MKNILMIILLILFSFASLSRPLPQKQAAEVLNDIYRDSNNTPTASIDVTLTATSFTTSDTALRMLEGTNISFTATNVTDSSFQNLLTLANDVLKAQIINNSGGEFYLRVDSTTKGVVAPGQESVFVFSESAGSIIKIQSISGTVSTGNLYLNVFGE